MKIDQKRLAFVSLENKVAVITGAASGIGRAAAKRLSGAGAKVALLDIDEAQGENAVEEIVQSGGEAHFFKCDVTSNEECRKITEEIIRVFGRIDILFNNAGIIIRKDTVNLSEKEWDFVLAVDLKSVFLLSHHVIPFMKKSGGGNIINTGSGWGLKGGPDAAAYCAAKGGVVNLTKAMAIDHGKDNIRVNCVCPGDVDTPLLHSEAVQLGQEKAEFMREAADRPLAHVGRPENIADAVLYFASDLSSWTTGAILVVDGGGLA
ncbi:MAG: SDR family NAD(P)-dependent oxidoreductase [Candidatus Aminicenantes bacterium]|jgi:NAD(P)-dependent dehydrogenase (short-subunit alcohol dehydrogenase family)